MPTPRNPVIISKDSTFEFWRQEVNALVNLLNYFVTGGGVFTVDSGQFTNVDIQNGTINAVTTTNSNINTSTINDAQINTSNILNSSVDNSDITNTDITTPGMYGTWDVNTHNATLNIATGTSAQAVAKGVGDQAELFWERTNQLLKMFDGTVPGGKTMAYSGATREEVIALVIALS